MDHIFIRLNGRGNAWPVFIGQKHPFYTPGGVEDYANVSYSIICSRSEKIGAGTVKWEVLVDAGHGTVQRILQTTNRIPEALFLTHHHLDHTLAIDWVIQSFYRTNDMKKKYPVYASLLCWELTLKSYPHLEKMVELTELKPGEKLSIGPTGDLAITPYPIFHGESARGAMMLVFEARTPDDQIKRAIITGDTQVPLLRQKDYDSLQNAELLYADANNRFPNPESNHWSICSYSPGTSIISPSLVSWKQELKLSHLVDLHLPEKHDPVTGNYFKELLSENARKMQLDFSIFDFTKRIAPAKVHLVHYGGFEDLKNLGEEILDDTGLSSWTNHLAREAGISSQFCAPKPGHTEYLL